jgi:hypothetical protein
VVVTHWRALKSHDTTRSNTIGSGVANTLAIAVATNCEHYGTAVS